MPTPHHAPHYQLVWRRGQKTKILLTSNSLTFAWELVAANSTFYDVSSLMLTQRFYAADFPIFYPRGRNFAHAYRTLVKRISDHILDRSGWLHDATPTAHVSGNTTTGQIGHFTSIWKLLTCFCGHDTSWHGEPGSEASVGGQVRTLTIGSVLRGGSGPVHILLQNPWAHAIGFFQPALGFLPIAAYFCLFFTYFCLEFLSPTLGFSQQYMHWSRHASQGLRS